MSRRSRTADEPIEAAVVSHDDPHFEPRPGGKQVCICCCPACSDESHCLCAGCSGDGLCSLPHDRTPHDGCDERYGCAAPVGDFDPDCVGPEGRSRTESPYRADLRNLARLAVIEGLFLLVTWPCTRAVHVLIQRGEVGWAQVVAVPVLVLCFANLGWLGWSIWRTPPSDDASEAQS